MRITPGGGYLFSGKHRAVQTGNIPDRFNGKKQIPDGNDRQKSKGKSRRQKDKEIPIAFLDCAPLMGNFTQGTDLAGNERQTEKQKQKTGLALVVPTLSK